MKSTKLDFIDSLRGIAAIYVVIYHLGHITVPAIKAPSWIEPITNTGGTAVMLFFVLSAFTLCMSMDNRNKNESTPTINYFIRRFFRIAPLFYFFIIITFIRDIFVFDVWHTNTEVIKNLLFIFNLFPGSEQGFVWASWTIGVEMIFYVTFPFIFKRLDNLGKSVAVFFALILLRMIWHNFVLSKIQDSLEASTYYKISILHHLPHFIIGIISYHIYKKINLDKMRSLGAGYAFISIGFFSYIGMVYGGISFAAFGDQTTVQTIIFSIILLGLSISPINIFVNKFFSRIGKISYSVYLSHSTIIFFMSPSFEWIIKNNANKNIGYFTCVLLSLIVIMVFSLITYKCIEIPGCRVGKKIINYNYIPEMIKND